MRRLILMRHAKSSRDDPASRDLDRPLNKRGRKSAGLIGAWMKRRGYLPDHALVSTARRTQETWSGVVERAGAAATTYAPEIYQAGAEGLLEVLRGAPEVERLLMLGHQPAIGAFARRLLAAPPDDAGFEKFPTCATAVLDFDIGGWAQAAWGEARLVDFVVPRALE